MKPEDLTNVLAILGACAAWYTARSAKATAKNANTTANDAQSKAEEALTMCSYPTCGHVCDPSPPKPLSARKRN